MTIHDAQIDLIKNILTINNLETLQELSKVLSDFFSIQNKTKETDTAISITELENKTFEEWNKQFNDEEQLDDVLPEYNMTLKAFRYKVWLSEQSEEKPIEGLMDYFNQRIHEIKTTNTL